MDWRRDKITAEELERKSKEYAEMLMKLAQKSAVGTQTSSAAVKEEKIAAEPVVSEAVAEVHTEEAFEAYEEAKEGVFDVFEKIAEEEDEAVAEISEEAVEAVAEISEEAIEAVAEVSEEAVGQEADDGITDEPSFGVFTAEEIMNGDYSGEGFEKAAEMIEEIAKKKEIMKELAENVERDSESDCDCTEAVPEIADAEDIFREAEICPKCGKRKNNGRRG